MFGFSPAGCDPTAPEALLIRLGLELVAYVTTRRNMSPDSGRAAICNPRGEGPTRQRVVVVTILAPPPCSRYVFKGLRNLH